MAYTKWQLAKAKAVLSNILKSNSKIMEPDEEELETPYRTSAREIVLISKIETKPTSFWKIVWLYFSAIIVDKFSKGKTT